MSIKRELREFAEEVEHLGITLTTECTKYNETQYVLTYNTRDLVVTLSEYTALYYLKGFSFGECIGGKNARGEK